MSENTPGYTPVSLIEQADRIRYAHAPEPEEETDDIPGEEGDAPERGEDMRLIQLLDFFGLDDEATEEQRKKVNEIFSWLFNGTEEDVITPVAEIEMRLGLALSREEALNRVWTFLALHQQEKRLAQKAASIRQQRELMAD